MSDTCNSRSQQSPIDLGKAKPFGVTLPSDYLQLAWPNTNLLGKLDDHGHYRFEDIPRDVGLCLGGVFFRLSELHFHGPSEHLLNDKSWPLEVHIVHQIENRDGCSNHPYSYAVLAVMVESRVGKTEISAEEDEASRFFQALTQQMHRGNGDSFPPSEINPYRLLPPNRYEYYRYEGSLTTDRHNDNPETVSWVVFKHPLLLDPNVLKAFCSLASPAKDPQPLNRRFVLDANQRR